MPPGVIWVASSIKESSTLADDQFNEWYDQVHLTDLLNTGAANVARRFKNLDASRPFQYLAIYNAADINDTDKTEFVEMKTTHELLGGKDITDVLNMDPRGLQLVQRVEGPPKTESQISQGLVTTCVDVAEEFEDEFNDWFDKQHLDMVSMAPGFVRGTRYKLADGHTMNVGNSLSARPKYATLYEYTSTDFPSEQLAIVSRTEWSKRILPQLTRIERDTWVPITEPVTRPGSTDEKKFGVY